jgi:integrase
MPSVWIARRPRRRGGVSYRVMYRAGGRETAPRYAGAFSTMREARIRRDWVAGELAALRMPDLRLGVVETPTETVGTAAVRWQASRVDVAEGTAQTYRVALGRVLPLIGDVPLIDVSVATVTELVAELGSLKRESLRKTLSVLAMVLDHEGVQPNPVRDARVKLPRGERRHVNPPTAAHVEAVFHLLPTGYRLPLLVLDATGMRVGELQALTWGDVDEPRGRWRVSASSSKTGVARWVELPPVLFAAVTEVVPRDDRTPERRVFGGFGADRFRTAVGRACTAAGVPAFSPHDLRHRRVSLLHLGGMPWARIGELVGHGDLVTTARTYTHVVADEAELEYARLL